jgi:hypothetical protein
MSINKRKKEKGKRKKGKGLSRQQDNQTIRHLDNYLYDNNSKSQT